MSGSEPRGGMPRGRGALGAPAAVLGLLLIFGGEAAAQLPGQELEGKPVTSIEFVGLRKLEPGAVKALMITKEGEPFFGESLDQDIKTLVTRDLFAVIPSARAEFDASGQGVKVTIVGDENARVQGVVFLGIIAFDRAELLPLIRTRSGGLVDDFTLQLDRKELIRFYRSGGYHYAEVDFTKTAERFGDLILFKITEGPKVTLRKVTFNGNESFTDDQLLKEMPFTDTPGFLSKTEFILEQLRRDVIQLGTFYFAKGYLDARVTLDDWQPSPDHEHVDVTIDIVEGDAYRVRSVTLEGSTLFEASELLALMRTEVGGIYEQGFNLDRDRRNIRDLYLDRGYTAVQIRDQSVIDLESNEVDVVLEIVEGELVRVGEVIVRGNIETRDRIIRREIELYTGEPLNLRKLERAQSRIRSLGYWQVADLNRGVEVQNPEIPFQEYQIFRDTYAELQETKRKNIQDISITVSEQDTGNLRFAAGIGSNSGVIGDITYQKNNFDPFDFPESFDDILDAFTGGGQYLTLSFQPGTQTSRWRLAWGNPRLFDGPFGLNAELYRTYWSREDWDERRLGYALQVTRRFGERIGLSLGLRDEEVEVDDINSSAPQLVFDFQGTNEVTSLRLEGRLNMVDNYQDPTDGYLVIGWWEHAGLWGDLEFNKAELSAEHYTQIYQDVSDRVHVIRIKGRAAWASEYGDSPDMPVYERFYLGGTGSLRGFAYRGVGPRDNGDPIGGKALWALGFEYAFPIFGDQLRGVAFVDTGSSAIDWGDSDIWNVRMGIGAGLRIVIPFLGTRPVAIDFGIPVISETEDDTQIISFSFGSNF